jgi:dienelactone hydrolase
MRITSSLPDNGILFTVDDIPGVLWTPAGGVGPLVLVGHGGGQHRTAPGMAARARRFTDAGFAVAVVDAPNHGDRPRNPELSRLAESIPDRIAAGESRSVLVAELHGLASRQSVPEWRAVLDAVQDRLGPGPVGYWGVSMGCGLGLPFVAAEPRVRAAVLGLAPVHAARETAARVTVPVRFLVQWHDELVPREESLALFDALGSTEKTLHANVGGHGEVPASEVDSGLRFLDRHLRP